MDQIKMTFEAVHPQLKVDDFDREMMARCIDIALRSGMQGEYPYGAVIARDRQLIVESTNRVAREHDVTRHAEAEAISLAQQKLGTISLSDCVIYATSEPCVYCSYAIRESRLGRVVYALHSPHMGGVSKWKVLTDQALSDEMPEVFDPPPEIVGGFMAHEVEQALLDWNPLVWGIIRQRGLYVTDPLTRSISPRPHRLSARLSWYIMPVLRRLVFDRYGRHA